MEFREPQSRIEAILQNMLGANNVLLPPFSRNEKILLAIMGEDIELEEPQSPIERCLMKWLGEDIELDEPMSNNERILHNIVGDEVEILPIQSVVEELLLEILRNSGEEVDIEGIPPLLLEKALAKALVSLTQYGLCAQDGTPTLDASIDIMCNNGAVRMVDDELPSGYTRLKSIHFDGASYFNSGIVPNTYDYEIETKVAFDNTASTPICAWGYMGNQSSLPRWLLASYSSGYLLNANTTAAMGVAFDTDAHVFKGVVLKEDETPKWQSYIDGEQRQSANLVGTASWEANTLPIFIGGRNNNGTAGNFFKGDFYYHTVKKAGVGIQNLVSARRNADGEIGIYDLVNGEFLTNQGTGTVTAGAVDYSHAHIGTDGTSETISIGGKNLNGGVVEHKGYTSTGGESTSTTFAGTLWKIPCKAGQKFTVSWSGFPDGVSGVFINTWKTNGDWNTRQAISALTSLTYTVGAGVGTINFTLYKTGGVTIGENAWIQVEYGTTATEYEPYRTPLTITNIPMLLSVGDYADNAEIVSGAIKRRIGIKVMDGTEAVSASGAGWAIAISDRLRSKVAMLCTHYPYSSATMANAPDKSIIAFSSQNIGIKDSSLTSADAVKDMFAAQFAAGTPVIVIYPLAEEVEESIEPQIIELLKGDNLICITAEVEGIILNAKYIKGA